MDQPRTLQEEALFAPPTPAQRAAAEIMLGLAIGFALWMLLDAPGVPRSWK